MPRLISIQDPESLQITILINLLLLTPQNTTKCRLFAGSLESCMETPSHEKELGIAEVDDHAATGTGLAKDEATLNDDLNVAKYAGPLLRLLFTGLFIEVEAEAVLGRSI
ncbi:hypothetical protein HG530_001316 [Fusarium avenaceum]|nr:hypothetical protein HG530_001316 [Fusarium avenaceum]